MKILTPQLSSYNRLPDMKKVTAVVLAGGRGKRMGPLCDMRPKPALPFGGNNRVIDSSLKNCGDSGIEDIIALVDYQRYYMSDYLKQWRASNQSSLHIREPNIGSYRGTADAVFQNLELVFGTEAEAVLILAADHVYRMDYREMFEFHKRVGADVTVGVVPVPIGQAHQFGVVNYFLITIVPVPVSVSTSRIDAVRYYYSITSR